MSCFLFDYSQEMEPRSETSIRSFMRNSGKDGKVRFGIKGTSALLLLENFHLNNSVAVDYMHGILLGVLRYLLSLWIDSCNHGELYYIGKWISQINIKLRSITLPKQFTRLPYNIEEYNRWKANELRSFLLYYGHFVLKDFLPNQFYDHFMLLSTSIYTFLKESISEEEFYEASASLIKFVNLFENLYGEEKMTYNIHVTRHIPDTVYNNGPLWAYSMFSSESKNSYLNRLVKGTRHCTQEVAVKLMVVENAKHTMQKSSKQNSISKPKLLKQLSEIFLNQIPDSLLQYPIYELKYLFKNNDFFESYSFEKRHSDYHVQLKNLNVGKICKIFLINGKNYFIFEKKYDVVAQSYQFYYLREADVSYQFYNIDEIKDKIILFEEFLGFVKYPNRYERD